MFRLRPSLTVCAAVLFLGALPAAPAPEQVTPAAALSRTYDFPGVDDPKTTLGEVLEMLNKRCTVKIDVNEKAFKDDNLDDVLKGEIANPTPLPAMPNARLSTILRKILARIPSNS